MKTCCKCLKSFPVSAEHFATQRRGTKSWFVGPCRQCRRKIIKEWHAERPEARIAAQLKRKFGMTLEEWNKMFKVQRGCCAICGKHQSACNRRLAVDHDHKTGKIRALLCQNCNHGLGHFYENLASLSNAINYLRNHAQ